MWWNGGRFGERLNSGLAVWIVVLSAIIPALDRDLLTLESGISSGGHEECAHVHHDHTICIQFGKQRWTTGAATPPLVFPASPGRTIMVRHELPPDVVRRFPTHSRAPPRTA